MSWNRIPLSIFPEILLTFIYTANFEPSEDHVGFKFEKKTLIE